MASSRKSWTIEFDAAAQKEFDRLDRTVARRVCKFLYRRLASLEDPRQIGESLRGKLSEYWKYPVGDYRIICLLEHARLVVVALRVAHRSEAYRP